MLTSERQTSSSRMRTLALLSTVDAVMCRTRIVTRSKHEHWLLSPNGGDRAVRCLLVFELSSAHPAHALRRYFRSRTCSRNSRRIRLRSVSAARLRLDAASPIQCVRSMIAHMTVHSSLGRAMCVRRQFHVNSAFSSRRCSSHYFINVLHPCASCRVIAHARSVFPTLTS